MDTRADALLCSINARLGALCVAAGAPETGEDLPPLGTEWLADIIALASDDAEHGRPADEDEITETF